MSRKFAAFDIDGTVIRTALFLQIVDELIHRGQLSETYRKTLDSKWEDYRARRHRDAFRAYNAASVDVLFQNLKGLSAVEYRKAVDAVVERSRDQVYVYTRDLIQSLKKQGYFLIALSGSEQYALEKFGEQFAFDIVIGDRYVEDNGQFTGDVESIFEDKGAALRGLITDNDLDLAGSIAVGDSFGDARMLEVVEQPVAFNPEAELFETAQQQGWDIVVERKNVIYKLQSNEAGDGRYILA